MRGMGAEGGPHDLDVLVFLKCIERRVAADKEVELIMNSLVHDAEGRVSKWLGRHPQFRISFFPEDELWLDMVTELMNRIPDKYKRHATFRLEHIMAEMAEKGGGGSRFIICYMQK